MKAQTTESKRNQKQAVLRHSCGAFGLALALLLGGCGGGGGGSAPAAVNTVPTVQAPVAASSYTVTSDNYGMDRASYLSATTSNVSTVLRAAIASGMTDPNFKTLSRIDIPAGAAITTGVTYALGSGGQAFPGAVYFFNGHQSTLLRTVGGSISFHSFGTGAGSRITGSFSAQVEDGNDSASPKAIYTIAASFDFANDSNGPVLPAPASATALAAASYDANCAGCHSLGSRDLSASGAPDLALKGGKVGARFTPDVAGHQGIRLTAADIQSFKVLLNVN